MLVASLTIELPWIVTIQDTSERKVSEPSLFNATDFISPPSISIRFGPSSPSNPEPFMPLIKIEFPLLMLPRQDSLKFWERDSYPPNLLSSRLNFSVKSQKERSRPSEELACSLHDDSLFKPYYFFEIQSNSMGNQLCAEAQNYCNPHKDVFAVIQYPTRTSSRITPPTEQQIILPTLSQTVTAVLDYKDSYLIDFMQRELFVKKKRFGDDIYEGQLSNNGLPNGVGKMYKADGSIFIGKFVMGHAEGLGLYVLEDGAYFEGELLNNKAECKLGKYFNRLFRYQGGFKDNLFHGQGKESSDQHIFVGTYEKGLKVCGELKWNKITDQEYKFSYYGKFDENGDFTDQGTLKEPTGSYTGTFLRGQKHGQGNYLFKNNNLKYEGQYQFGRKEGQGKISFADKDSLIYSGNWKNGLPQGTGFKYDENGQKVSTFFKQGINLLTLINPQQVR